MIVEFSFDNERMKRNISVPGLQIHLERLIHTGQHFLIARMLPSSPLLIEIEKIFVACGGYDTTYPIGCTVNTISLSDEREVLCHRKSGDLPGIVYDSMACYFKLPGVCDTDVIKGALQYVCR
jgi:hypothetical protein